MNHIEMKAIPNKTKDICAIGLLAFGLLLGFRATGTNCSPHSDSGDGRFSIGLTCLNPEGNGINIQTWVINNPTMDDSMVVNDLFIFTANGDKEPITLAYQAKVYKVPESAFPEIQVSNELLKGHRE